MNRNDESFTIAQRLRDNSEPASVWDDRVQCWQCENLFASEGMVDGYLLGPVCVDCDANLRREEDEENDRLDRLDDIE